ncbi:hypothetical protein [Orlajensenia leifsoniae]|nr:hypothetical protein [Leifsonia flava]
MGTDEDGYEEMLRIEDRYHGQDFETAVRTAQPAPDGGDAARLGTSDTE